MIDDLAKRFGVITGLSDHTMGAIVPVLSIAMGAKVIEKHFILDRCIGGPDAAFSMDEVEFTAMVKSVREAELAIGKIDYTLSQKQEKSREHSRSLYVVADVKKGELFTKDNVRSIRPGFGMHTKHYADILGKAAISDIEMGTRMVWELIAENGK
jgi:pseudaminic acid synthase